MSRTTISPVPTRLSARGGRHTEVMHRFAAQELADRRAQHGTAVGGTRIRRQSCALELELPAPAVRVHRFAQRDRAAIAQLAGPMTELVAAVVRGVRLHARQQRVATEDTGEFGGLHRCFVQPQFRGHLA
jgi:hypothetical protein